MARLVDKLKTEQTLLNITGNGGVHYNGVVVVEVYDDFIVVEGEAVGERSGGNWRGGKVNVNIVSITRLEAVATEQQVRLRLKGM